MNLHLIRFAVLQDMTQGALHVDGRFMCYTLEDAARIMAGFPKIPKRSAIPCGDYEVRVTFSNRFQYKTPEVLEVPGFTGIRVHPGNTIEDTEGCILPGLTAALDGHVSSSKIAFQRLMVVLAIGSGPIRLLIEQPVRETADTRKVWQAEAQAA